MKKDEIDWAKTICQDVTSLEDAGHSGIALLALCNAETGEWNFEKMMCQRFDGVRYLAFNGDLEQIPNLKPFNYSFNRENTGILFFGISSRGLSRYAGFTNGLPDLPEMEMGRLLVGDYLMTKDSEMGRLAGQFLGLFESCPWRDKLLDMVPLLSQNRYYDSLFNSQISSCQSNFLDKGN